MKSLSRLMAVTRKEVRQMRRDRLTFAMIFGIPLMQIILFGYAINTDVRNLRTAVADEANTHLSREFVAQLNATQVTDIRERVNTVAQLEVLLRSGKVSVGIAIPPDFDRRVADDTRAAVHILVDGSDPTIAGIADALRNLPLGFDTAMQIGTEAIDRLHSTATSHNRIIVVELMGHRAGWLTLGAGIAGGADVILIPEIPYDLSRVAEAIAARSKAGKHFSIVAVAEAGVIGIQDESSAVEGFLGVEPWLLQRFAVQLGGLNVDVLRGVVFRLDDELSTLVIPRIEPDHRAIEQGGAYLIDRVDAAAAVGLEQTQGAHDEPGAHLALVLVARIAVDRTGAVIRFQDLAHPPLGFPGLARVVEQVRRLHVGLVSVVDREIRHAVARGVEVVGARVLEALVQASVEGVPAEELDRALVEERKHYEADGFAGHLDDAAFLIARHYRRLGYQEASATFEVLGPGRVRLPGLSRRIRGREGLWDRARGAGAGCRSMCR